MPLYREKSKPFEAMQYIYPPSEELQKWLGEYYRGVDDDQDLMLSSAPGKAPDLFVPIGDYISKALTGSFWHFTADDFEQQYERVYPKDKNAGVATDE